MFIQCYVFMEFKRANLMFFAEYSQGKAWKPSLQQERPAAYATGLSLKMNMQIKTFVLNHLILKRKRSVLLVVRALDSSGASLLMVKICPAAVALTKKASKGAMAPSIGTNSLPTRR